MAVVFDIRGDRAMYRRPYTTTSASSYPFPPPTAVAGLLCAILGIDGGSAHRGCNSRYWEALGGTQIAVASRNPLRWFRGTLNFWNTKDPQKAPHVQIKHQFVSRPKYRIYVEGGVEAKLRHHLEKGTFIYTPYLGVAYALGEISFVGSFDWKPLEPEDGVPLNIGSLLPWKEEGMELDVLASGGAFKEILPFRMDAERQFLESVTVLYPVAPEKPLVLKKRGSVDVTRCGDDVVAWFAPWRCEKPSR